MIIGLIDKSGYVQLLDILYYKIGLVFPIFFIIFIAFEWAGRSSIQDIENLFLNKKRIYRRAVFILFFYVLYFLI